MEQDRPDEDEVKRSQPLGIYLINGHLMALNCGTESLTCDREAVAVALDQLEVLLAPVIGLLDPGAGRPVPLVWIRHVDGMNLSGATSFHLERPEAIPRPQIETPQALQRGWHRNEGDDGTDVDDARRDDTRRKLDGVVPVVVAGDALDQLRLAGGGLRQAHGQAKGT